MTENIESLKRDSSRINDVCQQVISAIAGDESSESHNPSRKNLDDFAALLGIDFNTLTTSRDK